MIYKNPCLEAGVSAENPVRIVNEPKTRAEKVAILNATQCPRWKIKDFLNKEFSIANIHFQHQIEVDEASGETSEFVRTTLITPEGEGISCGSTGVVSSIVGIIEMFGEPSTEEPFKVRLREVDTKSGNRFYQILLVE